MVVLLIILFLSNLWFGWAADQSQGSSAPSTSVPDIGAILGQLQETEKMKEETCAKVKSAIGSLAASKNWEVKADQYGVMRVKLPNGETYVINKDCKVVTERWKGTLSPAKDSALSPYAQGMITKQDFKFQVDVSLFKVLLQMLMYAAGIFWAVRAAQKLIAGELTEMLLTLFIGFIIVASMYVLYKWMPA